MDPYSNLLSTVISGWSCNGNFDPAGKQKTPICLDNKNKKKRNLIYVLLPFTYVYKWVKIYAEILTEKSLHSNICI